ncbi:hypothetical protein SZ64_15690 [Erythrobacter sp. SG61-1L]|uniref:class I SAM-dependent methyltransferase n=1 Tax=Erythrobacter sp. SG61-1L TaxID=1603897 RepID=UPI0006C9089A|nr:class I SAM-dependent methyltransferase [Erythrobacter sp. SG61-1L]KPL69423.1 hypothetical protein SZ64_15690 [Erythrobacter sp. SG61-1L]
MRKFVGIAALAAASVMGVAAAPALAETKGAAVPANPALDAALASKIRGEDGKRDKFRHPAETLAFFGVEPGMTVVDYMPNGWWYTRVLVPYLGKDGSYIGMNPDVSTQTGYMKNTYDDVAGKLAEEHGKWAGPNDAKVSGFNVNAVPEGLDGTVDRVLIFREVHNMFRFDWLRRDLAIMRKMLKPGGLIGITDHRVAENVPFERSDGNKGYMRESDVIALFAASGFDLVAKSEINANPKDPTDWQIGVWELPPSYAGADDAKRAKVDAIGESDRMTMVFRKRP